MSNNQALNNPKGTIGPHWKVHSLNGKYINVVSGGKNYKTKIEPTTLVCKKVAFYSHIDEYAFFKWIEVIRCIASFSQVNDELYLEIASLNLNDGDLTELLALFYRFKISMKQLAVFLNAENKEWFYEDKKAYWHKKVFDVIKK